ncbi:sugar MFS transporter [Fusibacter sp. 3D3]|uniref:MFS transporter n=1 Tax=Fusibacter sp. 3D3 TaxID=1048380 RepID=UPI00085326FC|nr:MFS transporter [Fusibacter sp. 3D3]GAU79960.1 permeases of the major facilitator superfamily [Fusibacter sp. 3D3]
MITFVLLIIIYLAFISLGLPDALLGVSWPLIRSEWALDLDAVGMVSIVVTFGTITSSLLSGKLIKHFGEGRITFFSGVLTGGALLGFAYAPSYFWLIALALPLGFGAGSVDTALNHYVSLHFKAHHMNWLHSFWGIGATAGPIIMSNILLNTHSWRTGYSTIAVIQLFLAVIIFLSLPLWKKQASINSKLQEDHISDEPSELSGFKIIRVKGVPYALLVFVFYCAAEYAVGLWGSSYLVQVRAMTFEAAARWIALYYGGITVGRIIAGFISFKLNNKQLILLGICIAMTGSALLFLNFNSFTVMISFALIGLGFAPIFPAMIHETPQRFGKNLAQSIIGFQMASAYTGIAILPPLLGIIIDKTHMIVFPIFVILCVGILFYLTTTLNRIRQN